MTLDAFLLMAGVASAPRTSLQEAFELFDANKDGFVSLKVCVLLERLFETGFRL